MKQKLALIALLAVSSLFLTGCLIEKVDDNGNVILPTTDNATDNTAFSDPAAKVTIVDLKVGTGATAKTGDTVTVHYVGTLTNGTKFDSSRDKNTPFTFTLGAGTVIQGWEQGIPGMKVGGLRRLTVPPMLGYGENAYGSIPASSTLIFEVELLSIK